jgi:hypothetical protein
MHWLYFSLIAVLCFIPCVFLAVKLKEATNKLISKEDIDESSPKSWPGDLVATLIFFIYSILVYRWMP